MKALQSASVLVLALLVGSCSTSAPSAPSPLVNADSASARAPASPGGSYGTMAATPDSATVQFGLVDVGSGFPPPSGHDRSGHANDTLVPGTVTIDAGGTVTFNIVNPHQIAIYEPGKRPEDVDTSALVAMPPGCPNPGGPARINDTDGLVAFYLQPCNQPRTPITHQFDEPGRYLVICAFNPHFQIGMYGWVIVRDR